MEFGESPKEINSGYKARKKTAKSEYKNEIEKLRTQRDAALAALPQRSGGKKKHNDPKLSVLEEIGNAVTHGLGAVFAVVAFVLMLSAADGTARTVSAYVYFFGLFILFTMSCLYHAFPHGSTVKRVFRRFDHSSIYLLIGATFAPLLLAYIGGTSGMIFFVVQWTVIAVGITLVAVFGPGRLRWLHMPLYLLLGWSALLFMPRMLRDSPQFFAWIVGGGLAYTIGVIPYRMKGAVTHFIWHFFVLAGAVIQWVGIYLYIYLK